MTEREVALYTKGLKEGWEKEMMTDMIMNKREQLCLTAEEMLQKAKPGQRYSVGFRSLIEITANDGESIEYIDDDGYTVTATREDMEKAFEEQSEKDFCRYMPILVEEEPQ